jgi:predicted nucleic acid-binding protein
VLVVDTGVLLAAADDNDPDHQRCVDLVEGTDEQLVTTPLVIAETGYLIDRQLGPNAEAGFYRSLARGDVRVETLTASDYERIAELVDRYGDFPLGGTDASLVAIAERLRVAQIASLDHRHFTAVRPSHIETFDLLP